MFMALSVLIYIFL